MILNATLINLYHVCKRECWFHANGVRMEQTSDIVYDGKLIGENAYPQRSEKYEEIELSALWNDIDLTGKIDFYDRKNNVVHETKRSDKVDTAHQWQVKFYIWLLELNGILNATGRIEYPKLRTTDDVLLINEDRLYLQSSIQDIVRIIQSDNCPAKLNSSICKSCSYYELCYVTD